MKCNTCTNISFIKVMTFTKRIRGIVLQRSLKAGSTHTLMHAYRGQREMKLSAKFLFIISNMKIVPYVMR